jgi:hypothetical protein
MFRKIILAGIAIGSLVVACGPSANADANEGGSCTQQGDCGGDLTCQPIHGRVGDFCCPTPAQTSSHANCQSTSS